MKKRPIQIFLAILISCYIFVFPAYFRYSALSDIDLFSTDLNYENSDQDDQLDVQQHESDAFPSNALSIPFLPEANFFVEFSYCLFQLASFDQRACILRC
jgi:hypothetical protein